jgi:DNA-binding NarL/FixJ family response regulator
MDKTILRKSVEKKQVVLIEDYKLVRIGLRMVLDGDDALKVVGEGATAAQGLQLIQDLHPELVILDLGLPDMDGLQLTREIRKRFPEIKILVLTSHDKEEEVLLALAAGANAYCLKDIMSDRLVEVVKSVCEGCIWLDPSVASRALHVFSETAKQRVIQNRLTITAREREVLRLLVEGMSNNQITRALEINLQATKALVRSILQKLSAQDRMEAATKAIQQSMA